MVLERLNEFIDLNYDDINLNDIRVMVRTVTFFVYLVLFLKKCRRGWGDG